MDFKLWLEFEEVDPGNWDTKNEFANIQVELADGRHYGINVWTYAYLETAIQKEKADGENSNGSYITPPDLFVEELTRECVHRSIKDLLAKGDLEVLLNTSIKDEKS
ncbi:MAG: hypothetical protein HKN52_07440 [Eudoraea sp.]|nr:hypothetical protein [Eudoraea sp.]